MKRVWMGLGTVVVLLVAACNSDPDEANSSEDLGDGLKANGEDCSYDGECRSSCCYQTRSSTHPFCTGKGIDCMGSSSSSSSGSTSSSSGSSGSTSSSSSSGSSGTTSSGSTSSGAAAKPAYVEFMLDSGKFQSGTGYYVESVEAEGGSYGFHPIAGGTGTCTDKIAFKGAPVQGLPPQSLYVPYTLNVRNYASLDAAVNGQPYARETYKAAFSMNDLTPGCNTLYVVESAGQGLRLAIQH